MKKLLMAAMVTATLALASSLHACTGFCVTQGDLVLVGNNEDWKNPNTKVWYEPGENGTYGRVYFGFDNFSPQGGMNEKGLVFDGFATAPNAVTRSLDKPVYPGNLLDKAMSECACVDDVLDLLSRYNLKFMEPAMYFVADARGDSAIIEGDEVLRKQGRYQVVTNFYQSQVEEGEITCDRYKIARAMLGGADEVSVDLCKRVLAATHNEEVTPTLYSNIYDVKNRVVHLYHFHNFQNEVKIDLRAELAKGRHAVDLPDLFPRTFAAERFRAAKTNEMRLERMQATHRVAPNLVRDYVGQYRITHGEHRDLTVTVASDTRLYIRVAGQDDSDIHPISDSEFVHVDPVTTFKLTFVRDANGNVAELKIDQNGETHTAQKMRERQ